MGLPVERFVNHVDDNLQCSICHGVFINPVVIECGHTFCYGCFKQWLDTKIQQPADNQNITCPACRCQLADISKSNTDVVCLSTQLVRPVIALKNLIRSMPIYCEYAKRGCTTIDSVDVIHNGNHNQNCAYVPVDCAGCGRTVNRIELAAHQLSCFGIQAEIAEPCTTWQLKHPNESRLMIDVGIQTLKPWIANRSRSNGTDCDDHVVELGQQNAKLLRENSYCLPVGSFESQKVDCLFDINSKMNYKSLQLLNISLMKLVRVMRRELDAMHEEVINLKNDIHD